MIKILERLGLGRIAAEMRNIPVNADLLLRATKPMIEKIERESRENAFWRGAIAQAQSDPARLDRIRQMRKMLTEVKPAELQKIARQYLTDSRRNDFRIVSKTFAKKQMPGS